MSGSEAGRAAGGGFHTTRWSLVVTAAGTGAEARAGLEELCAAYWYPLYAYARRRGRDAAEAEDLTQGFFASLLERGDLAIADPERGRFRSFLLAALRHHMANEWDRANAQKRAGRGAPLSIDWSDADRRFGAEPVSGLDPEREFERSWALATLERALERTGLDYERRGQLPLFEHLKPQLAPGGAPIDGSDLAAELDLSPGAARVALHRLRARFGAALRAEVADTLRRPEELEDELRALLDALAAPPAGS